MTGVQTCALPISAATADGDLLPMWGGAMLFTAYGLVFAAIGTALMAARDVA